MKDSVVPAHAARSTLRRQLCGKRSGLTNACALSCALMFVAVDGAKAAVLYTYTFTQDGYTSTSSLTGALSGSFVTSVTPGGQINESDLSSIDVTFDFGLGKSSGAAPSLFSYDPSLGARGLELIIDVTSGTPGNFPICVGGVAQISFGGCSPGGPGVEGSFNLFPGVQFYTTDLPVITVTVPEPSTWMEMLFGFAALGLAGARRLAKRGSPHKSAAQG